MVHKYKLTYFGIRYRAEPARLIFAYAGVDYEDRRIEGAEWPALKPKTPFGSLPTLEIDGRKVTLAQSKAIARYLGNEFNLIPKDHILAAKADSLVDGHADVFEKIEPYPPEQDPKKKEKIATEIVTPFLDRYEKFLTETGTDYFVTNSITWADIYLFNYLHNIKNLYPEAFNRYAKLAGFVDKLAQEPKIKAWLDKRPDTPL